jgi:hypothetical protein
MRTVPGKSLREREAITQESSPGLCPLPGSGMNLCSEEVNSHRKFHNFIPFGKKLFYGLLCPESD